MSGRKALPPAAAVGPQHIGAMPADLAADESVVQRIEAGYGEDRDLVNRLIGQQEMADALAQFSLTVRVSKLAFIKENKLYRSLKGRKNSGRPDFSGTWEEFCTLIGRSVDQVDEDIKNLRTFGEAAMDALSNSGVGYRELRQFRRLPEDSKNALIEVANTGDKDALLELAEDLVAKQSAEKAKLAKELEGAKADAEIARAETAKRDAKVRKAEYAQAKAERVWIEATADEQEHKLVEEVDRTIRAVKETLGLNAPDKEIGLRGAMLRLARHAEENRGDALPLLGEKIAELLTAVRILRDDPELMAPILNDLGAEVRT